MPVEVERETRVVIRDPGETVLFTVDTLGYLVHVTEVEWQVPDQHVTISGWVNGMRQGWNSILLMENLSPEFRQRLEEKVPKLSCPDGGTCHHACRMACFRVRNCEPLSGVHPGNKWPEDVKKWHAQFPDSEAGFL
jgi:hypothetical protein